MVDFNKDLEYVPGFYSGTKPCAADLADHYIREWDEEQKKKIFNPKNYFPPFVFPVS